VNNGKKIRMRVDKEFQNFDGEHKLFLGANKELALKLSLLKL
jgi:hypothetical protein